METKLSQRGRGSGFDDRLPSVDDRLPSVDDAAHPIVHRLERAHGALPHVAGAVLRLMAVEGVRFEPKPRHGRTFANVIGKMEQARARPPDQRGAVRQADRGSRHRAPPMRCVWRPRATGPAPEGHVLERGQVRNERVVLEHDPGRPITGLGECRRSFIARRPPIATVPSLLATVQASGHRSARPRSSDVRARPEALKSLT